MNVNIHDCQQCCRSVYLIARLLCHTEHSMCILFWLYLCCYWRGVCVSVCLLQRAFCAYCSDRIWGLGRQGFKCINCKLLVHKKCHKLLKLSCGAVAVSTVNTLLVCLHRLSLSLSLCLSVCLSVCLLTYYLFYKIILNLSIYLPV